LITTCLERKAAAGVAAFSGFIEDKFFSVIFADAEINYPLTMFGKDVG
jgi:hypothetical protein